MEKGYRALEQASSSFYRSGLGSDERRVESAYGPPWNASRALGWRVDLAFEACQPVRRTIERGFEGPKATSSSVRGSQPVFKTSPGGSPSRSKPPA